MKQEYSISWPEVLSLRQEARKSCRGAKQEWFPTDWQRKAGCGPTTAATMAAYLSHVRPELTALYPSGSQNKADFLELMERMWQHVTPGRKGVNSLRMFTDGFKSFAAERQCMIHTRELDIPRLRILRPSFSQCVAFIRTGLSCDCPVAFLNFSRGRVHNLDSWHWVPIIAMEQQENGQTLCSILDGGRERKIDFRLWYMTSMTGGGLIYIPREHC